MPEIVITNAHDRYPHRGKMGAELLPHRLRQWADCRRPLRLCPHSPPAIGLAQEQVIEGAYRVIEQFPRMIEARKEMAAIELRPEESRSVRPRPPRSYGKDGDAASPIESDTLLRTAAPGPHRRPSRPPLT